MWSNLGAEDYLEIIKNCTFIVIDQIPQFNDVNSNQQQRFITLLDVIYDKDISDKNIGVLICGGNNDITRVIQSLPGISPSVGGFRNDIIIRGGGPNETVYYIDGIVNTEH